MKRTVSCKAKCPYYKCEERHEIFCRGPMEGTSLHLAFAIPAEKKEYMNAHCKDKAGFCRCLIAQVLSAAEDAQE